MPYEPALFVLSVAASRFLPQCWAPHRWELEKITHEDDYGQNTEEVGRSPIEGSRHFAVVVDHNKHTEIHHADFIDDHNRFAGLEGVC